MNDANLQLPVIESTCSALLCYVSEQIPPGSVTNVQLPSTPDSPVDAVNPFIQSTCGPRDNGDGCEWWRKSSVCGRCEKGDKVPSNDTGHTEPQHTDHCAWTAIQPSITGRERDLSCGCMIAHGRVQIPVRGLLFLVTFKLLRVIIQLSQSQRS